MRRMKVYVEDQVRFDTAAGTWQRSSQRMRILSAPDATDVDEIYIGATETRYAFHEAFDDAHALYVNPLIKRRALVPFTALQRLTAKLHQRHPGTATDAEAVPHNAE